MNINERMKEARIERGITQKEIAEKLNMTQQQYGLYETGKRDIPALKIKELAEIYNISADYLLGLPKGLPYPD